ncbi:MAG: response regulator [Thermodesulfobacteriota bacterium]
MSQKQGRVMVIEDDREMRSLLEDFIQEEGYEVRSADNGSEAFCILAKDEFDLIITDVRMPGLSGLDILPGMRKLQPHSAIIVITAFGSEEVYTRAMERGADGYLQKPISLETLRIMIKKMLFPDHA